MIIRLITKLGVSGGALTGSIFAINPSIINDKGKGEEQKEERFEIKSDQIKTLVDIEIFAKQNKCTFAFVNAWNEKEKKVKKPKEFIDGAGKQEWHVNKERSYWPELMSKAIQAESQKCKNNNVLVFFNRSGLKISGP